MGKFENFLRAGVIAGASMFAKEKADAQILKHKDKEQAKIEKSVETNKTVDDKTLILNFESKEEIEVMKNAFKGKRIESDENTYRTISCGTSPDQATAMSLAKMNAQIKLLKNEVKVSNATLKNMRVIDEAMFRNNEKNTYTYVVAVEIEKTDVKTE